MFNHIFRKVKPCKIADIDGYSADKGRKQFSYESRFSHGSYR